MVLDQHEAAQFRPKMSVDAGRQRRRQNFAVRLLPARVPEMHTQRTGHQVLYDETRVALEAGAVRRGRDPDGPDFVYRKLRRLVALLPSLAPRSPRQAPIRPPGSP